MKRWIDADQLFRSNTDQEVWDELYGSGTTAAYTRRIQEINAILAKEEAERQQKRMALQKAEQSEQIERN